MRLSIDLRAYCDPQTIAAGNRVRTTQSIQRKTTEQLADGRVQLSGKIVDSFNFVNRVRLVAEGDGSALVSFRCDCRAAAREGRFCAHCAALVLDWNEEDLPPAWETPWAEAPHPAPAAEEKPAPAVEEKPAPAARAAKPAPVSFQLPEPEAPAFPGEAAVLPPAEEPPWQLPQVPEPEDPPEPVPITSMEILFGESKEEGTPVHWRPNDTRQVFHLNTGIIGTMGTGKTQFTKSLVTQLRRQQGRNYDGSPLGVLIFDYKGDYNETKADFVQATNARILKPYLLPYNPLALNPARTFKPLLPMHTANAFKDTISKIYNLGPKQQQTLLDCIVLAYQRQGIRAEDPATWSRPAPTFEQVYRVYAQETEGRPKDSLAVAISKLHQFHLFEEDPRRAHPLRQVLRGVVVIDLSGYDQDIQSLIVEITLDQFYAQMQAGGSSRTDGTYRELKDLILVDEADGFMAQGFPSLRKIMKEGREFGVGVILSTQSLTHFIGGSDDYSRYVFTWVVHNVSDLKQRDVEYVFKLQPKSPEIQRLYADIKGLAKHESVVKLSNDLPFVIRDRAFWQLLQEQEKKGDAG